MATREDFIRRRFTNVFDRLRWDGLAHECRIENDVFYDALRICIDLPHGERRFFSYSGHELAMGGERGLHYFADIVYRDCRDRCQREGWPDQGYYRDHPPQRRPPVRMDALYGYATIRPELHAQFGGFDWGGPEFNEAAEKKSRDLFILGAGRPAFDVLEAGKGLPIKGSKGTKYTLHKRAAYCVERKKDGAKLCAVVPGVPLYDHLLGIKIMVENDEPKFLKIANVSPGDGRRSWAFW